MSEPGNKSIDQNAIGSQRKKLGPLYIVGLLLMNLGLVFTTMKTVSHLRQEPPEPLGFDLTLRYGDGGFIAYGVAIAVLGFSLILIEARRQKWSTSRITFILVLAAATAGVAWVVTPIASRPQLDVMNTGTTAVSARHGSDEFVIHPAQTWSLRYSVGDTLTLSVAVPSKSTKVVLERGGAGGGSQPAKWKAEVNADGEDIRFRFIDVE